MECPEPSILNYRDHYANPDLGYSVGYFRDITAGQPVYYQVLGIGGTVLNWAIWISANNYSNAWWWWGGLLDGDNPPGIYTFRVILNGVNYDYTYSWAMDGCTDPNADNFDPLAIIDNTRPTACYTAVLDHTGNLILGLADMAIYDDFKPAHWQHGKQEIQHWNHWCVDTNLPADTLHYLASEKADRLLFAVVTSPAKAHRLRQVLPTLDAVFANNAEADTLVNSNTGTLQTIEEQARALCDLGALRAIVTAGVNGAAWADPDTAPDTLPVHRSAHSQSRGQAMCSLALR